MGKSSGDILKMKRKIKLGLVGIALASAVAATDISYALTPLPPMPPTAQYTALKLPITNAPNLTPDNGRDNNFQFKGFLYGLCILTVLGFGTHAIYSEFRKN